MTLEAELTAELRNPPKVFDFCPDCGKPAVMNKDGLKVCGNCGEVVP